MTDRIISDRKRWLALAVLVAAQFMVVLDVAIVNVALPDDQDRPSLQPGGPAVGHHRLLDPLRRRAAARRAGRRPPRTPAHVHGRARALQRELAPRRARVVGGLAHRLPRRCRGSAPRCSRPPRSRSSPPPSRRAASATSRSASGARSPAAAAAAGVLLGGALTSAFSWSWIFFVNVPVGAVVLALSPVLLRESRAQLDHRHFDTQGAVSITGGLMLLVYALTRASQHGWATGETDRACSPPPQRCSSRSSSSSCARRRRSCRCGSSACGRCRARTSPRCSRARRCSRSSSC